MAKTCDDMREFRKRIAQLYAQDILLSLRSFSNLGSAKSSIRKLTPIRPLLPANVSRNRTTEPTTTPR